jgi:hypothetical protein
MIRNLNLPQRCTRATWKKDIFYLFCDCSNENGDKGKEP